MHVFLHLHLCIYISVYKYFYFLSRDKRPAALPSHTLPPPLSIHTNTASPWTNKQAPRHRPAMLHVPTASPLHLSTTTTISSTISNPPPALLAYIPDTADRQPQNPYLLEATSNAVVVRKRYVREANSTRKPQHSTAQHGVRREPANKQTHHSSHLALLLRS